MAASAHKGAAINMTPFIDVVLVLLVIVMLTSQVAAHAQRGLAATLPKAENAQPQTMPHVISALNDGRLFYDQRAVLPADLLVRLQQSDAAHARVLLEVEADVPHHRVVAILDSLAFAGITDAAFAAESSTARNDK